MNIKIDKSFAKDVQNNIDSKVLHQVADIIESVERSNSLTEIKNCKKLKGRINAFRIKMGVYRVGIILESDTVEFVRFLRRKDIYKYFPK